VIVPPVFTAALAAAQFSSGVSLVEVYATVTDGQGQPVNGLTAADFQVTEDGVAQPISTFAAGEFPLSVVVSALRPDDEVTVLAVGSEIETITPPVPARVAVATAWDAITPWGSTPLYDVIMKALDIRVSATRRRALLIVSDGFDRYSDATAADVVDRARRSNVLAYPIAIGKGRPPALAELASVTGGHSFTVDDPKKLDAAVGTIARELRSQYLLGYVPARAPASAAEWRAIDVNVNRAGMRVRARDGYFAR